MSRCFVSIHRQWGNSASPHANSVSVIGSGWPVSRCELQGRPLLEHVSGTATADGTLRISTGEVTQAECTDYFTSDIDGSMGNSGSPAIDEAGTVVGMFSQQLGTVRRNRSSTATPNELFVSSALAKAGSGHRGNA
jgi:S1-C subfamily serine protease